MGSQLEDFSQLLQVIHSCDESCGQAGFSPPPRAQVRLARSFSRWESCLGSRISVAK